MYSLPEKALLIVLVVNVYSVSAQDTTQQTEPEKTGLFNTFKKVAKGIKDGVVEELVGESKRSPVDDVNVSNEPTNESTTTHQSNRLATGLDQVEQFIASLSVSEDGQLALNGLSPGVTISDVEHHLATRLKVQPSTHASLNSNVEAMVSIEKLDLRLAFYSENNHTVLTGISSANPLNLTKTDLKKLKASLKQKGLKEYELEDGAYEANSQRHQLLYLRPNSIKLEMGVDDF